MLHLTTSESKTVMELEGKELHTFSSDVVFLNQNEKKVSVNFKALIYKTGIILFNLQEKWKEKEMC